MSSPSLPNLNSINQELAGNVSRVSKFIETLPFHVDNLLAATQDQDWPEVARQTEYLAGSGDACNLQEISKAARSVQTAIASENHLMVCRAVLKLVTRCGSVKMPAQGSNAKMS